MDKQIIDFIINLPTKQLMLLNIYLNKFISNVQHGMNIKIVHFDDSFNQFSINDLSDIYKTPYYFECLYSPTSRRGQNIAAYEFYKLKYNDKTFFSHSIINRFFSYLLEKDNDSRYLFNKIRYSFSKFLYINRDTRDTRIKISDFLFCLNLHCEEVNKEIYNVIGSIKQLCISPQQTSDNERTLRFILTESICDFDYLEYFYHRECLLVLDFFPNLYNDLCMPSEIEMETIVSNIVD